MPRLFIVGGSDAGISAALRARELAPDWQVTVAVADSYPNFSVCGIPYFLSKEVARVDNLAHRKADDIRSLGIELLLDHRAEHVDPREQKVLTRDKTGEKSEHVYDKLVIATGANSIRPPFRASTCPACFYCAGSATRWRSMNFSRSVRRSTWSSSEADTSDSKWPKRSETGGSTLRSSKWLPAS